jgi:DNA polymerase elongation subunit (family B)
MSYRNVSYNPKDESMTLFTWDPTGKRVAIEASYNPYLYVEVNSESKTKSIFNTNLKKKVFRNQYERSKYIKESGNKRLFENLSLNQQFLIDTYWRDHEKEDFIKYDLKIGILDIETYSPDEFPIPETATHPVNIITIYDSITKKYYSWGVKPYENNDDEVIYKYCQSEKMLLNSFLEHLEEDHYDVLTGWNSNLFDLPYLVNRIRNVLGEDDVFRLSPTKRVYSRSMRGQFGKEQIRWFVDGVSCVDYLDVYKRFCLTNRDSYKLDNIGRIELQESKVDYGNTNLSGLADENWQTFVDYNIQDVKLVVKLEQKLQYLTLLRMLSHIGLTSMEAAMGNMGVIVGACAIRGRVRGQIVPTFIRPPDNGTQNEGAYVKDPERGFQKYVVSFDANSLYPSTMITLNLSPETKMGVITKREDDKVFIRDANYNEHTLSEENFKKLVVKEDLAISRAGVLFTQKRKGLIPEVVDHYYGLRVKVRKELKKLKRQLNDTEKSNIQNVKDEINRLNIKQQTIKVLINSVYGALGNKVFPLGDDDLARSITLTGQAVAKTGNKILNKFIREICQKEIPDVSLYSDTDSSYVTLKDALEALNITPVKDGKVTKEFYDLVEKVEKYLNDEIIKWGKESLNSKDCRFEFKREKICDAAMFLAKKRYVLHVLDDEGIPCDFFKYTGVEVVRTTMPKSIKPLVKNIIETMILTQSMSKTNEVLEDIYEKFKQLSVEELAFVSGIKGLEGKAALCDGFNTTKGMPAHFKAAYFHNLLLKKLNVEQTYEKIGSGDKVRYFYVKKPNRYGIDGIGFKYYYPKEFSEIFEPDHEVMFSKIVYSVVERFYEAVGWSPKKPGEINQCDLFDLLKFD